MERASKLIRGLRLSGDVISSQELACAAWPDALGKTLAARMRSQRLPHGIGPCGACQFLGADDVARKSQSPDELAGAFHVGWMELFYHGGESGSVRNRPITALRSRFAWPGANGRWP